MASEGRGTRSGRAPQAGPCRAVPRHWSRSYPVRLRSSLSASRHVPSGQDGSRSHSVQRGSSHSRLHVWLVFRLRSSPRCVADGTVAETLTRRGLSATAVTKRLSRLDLSMDQLHPGPRQLREHTNERHEHDRPATPIRFMGVLLSWGSTIRGYCASRLHRQRTG